MIEAIVAIVFGVVITAVGACTGAGVVVIVLGALLLATGIGCLIYEIIAKNKAKRKAAEADEILIAKDIALDKEKAAHAADVSKLSKELSAVKMDLLDEKEKSKSLSKKLSAQKQKTTSTPKTDTTKTSSAAKSTAKKSTKSSK